MKSSIVYAFLGFIVGVTISLLVALYGFDLMIDGLRSTLSLLLGGFIAIIITIFSLYLTREKWLSWLLKTTESRIEEIAQPLGQAIILAADHKPKEAVDEAAKCARILLAYYSSGSLRRWLVSSSIAGAATLIGMSTAALMSQQNELLKTQNAIAEIAVNPQFLIRHFRVKAEGEQAMSDEKILVENAGGVVWGINSNVAFFFDVTLTPSRPSNESYRKRIAVADYFYWTGNTAEGKGTLLTIEGHRNVEKAIDLEKRFREYAISKGFMGNIDTASYIKLSYQNHFGDDCSDYFFIPVIGSGVKLPTEKGVGIFNMWSSAFSANERPELDQLTPEKLFELATKK